MNHQEALKQWKTIHGYHAEHQQGELFGRGAVGAFHLQAQAAEIGRSVAELEAQRRREADIENRQIRFA
jgi:hypothetical protein